MSIVLRIEPETLERSSTSPKVIGIVYFDFGAHQFPEKGWHDFVTIVLSWWLAALKNIALGVSDAETLQFMDGPVRVKVERVDDDTCWLACVSYGVSKEKIEHEAKYPTADVIRTVLSAAATVRSACEKRGWDGDDIDALETAIGAWELGWHKPARGSPH